MFIKPALHGGTLINNDLACIVSYDACGKGPLDLSESSGIHPASSGLFATVK